MADGKQNGERGYLHRAYIRKSTRADIERITDKKQWEFKQDKRNYTKEYPERVRSGRLRDANTGREIRGKVDIGHKSGYEERVMRECAERMHLSQKDYNDLMNNSKLYQFEDHRSNRSHKFEESNKKTQVSKAMREINRYTDAKKNGQTHAESDHSVHKSSALRTQSSTHSVKSANATSVHSNGSHSNGARVGHTSSTSGVGAGHTSAPSAGHGGHGSSGGNSGGGHGGHGSSGGGHSK